MSCVIQALRRAGRIKWLAGITLAVAAAAPIAAKEVQHADARFTPRIAHPAYVSDGPVVAVDEAHHNFHTLEGKFDPFGKLAAADGYRVRPSAVPFSAQSLTGVNLLVIANARVPDQGGEAFTPQEIAAVRQWVEDGGSLLLIADHAPFGTAARPLAEAFGVDMGTGFAIVRQGGAITANIEYRGSELGVHPILAGRDSSERVEEVKTFTGQSLGIPAGATGLLLLPPNALGVLSLDDLHRFADGAAVQGMRIGGRAQAVALTVGRGRVVVAGEAAMFTEQIIPDLGRVGLTVDDDQQFVLNILHWLSRTLP